MTEPTADDLARWAEEHRPLSWGLCGYCEDEEWPCSVTRLLALVAAQAEQIAVVQSRLLSAELDAGLVIEASRDRADAAEAKIARVRAALDADQRSSVLLAVARAIIDDEPVLDTEATP